MVNNVIVNVDHGRDFHHIAEHVTKLRNFTKICEFSSFPFSFQLMFDQKTLSNLIVFVMISQ